ncbi:hypothetical protein BGX27_001497 [Mortierella sp. AM989]|nr:hypothetical protein BGX27_001497 [Mortierella sp. AM989]
MLTVFFRTDTTLTDHIGVDTVCTRASSRLDMDHALNRSKISFAYTKPSTISTPSTSVAAAAPEPSTLAVKLSENPEGHAHSGDHEIDNDSKQSYRDDQRSSLKDGDHGSRSDSPTIRRSRSGRLLRSTVQYDERNSRSSSPENSSEPQGPYGRRTRSSFHNQTNQSEDDGHAIPSEQESQDATPGNPSLPESHDNQNSPEHNDKTSNGSSRPKREIHQEDHYGDNHDELASDDQDDGYGDEGDDVNNEGSESAGTNSSKNDDGTEPLVVSMYGSPSLVKVRSMFIDKLYKMVEDPSIQHLISWAKEGDMFYVYNCIELSSSILPKFFKHNNWQSFVRQLNMYGFHKIYRYDREESNMNRRNPETQRWQFYHPDFQRDQPHLRNNIKRKSARSVNIAPTFSRVVFERDKGGYYMQQESPARSFNGQSGHTRSHSSNHSQEQNRHNQMHGGHPPGSMAHHYPPHPSVHRSPHDASRPPPIRPVSEYRPPSGHHLNDLAHSRDEKDLVASKLHLHPPHQQQARRDHELHHHGQHHYQGPPYHQQQQHSYGGPHQRQHSYAGTSSQAHYSPEQSHAHKAQGYGSPRPPAHESLQAHPMGAVRPGNQGHGHVSSREPGYLEHDVKLGAVMSGGHFRSQSAPGLDPRRGDVTRGPHPFSQHEANRSPPHPGSQAYYSREHHPSQSTPSHRHQSSFDEVKPTIGPEGGLIAGEGPSPSLRSSLPKHSLSPMDHSQPHPSVPGHAQHIYPEQHRRNQPLIGEQEENSRRFTPPPPQSSAATSSHPGQYQPPVESALPGESLPTTPGLDPNVNPSPHDLVPRTVKNLEGRLQFVEEAYMSLRQYVQDLQNFQASQDHTIAWMRDRMEQLTEAGTPRDVITSPPLSQAGVVPSKRKAEYSPGDNRDWSRRGPLEHHQAYSRQGLSSGPPSSSPLPPPPALPGQGPGLGSQGPSGRYDSSGFHPSFHNSSQVSPHTPASSQQQPPQQRQHPSPPMNPNNSHYQKPSITNIHHD